MGGDQQPTGAEAGGERAGTGLETRSLSDWPAGWQKTSDQARITSLRRPVQLRHPDRGRRFTSPTRTRLPSSLVATCGVKGGGRHRRAGRWFARLIYAAAILGAMLGAVGVARPSLLSISDPQHLDGARQLSVLTLYLLLIIVAPTQHGIGVIAAGPAPARLRSLPHLLLNSLLVPRRLRDVACRRHVAKLAICVGGAIRIRDRPA